MMNLEASDTKRGERLRHLLGWNLFPKSPSLKLQSERKVGVRTSSSMKAKQRDGQEMKEQRETTA